MKEKFFHSTYGFRFKGEQLERVAGLLSLGKEVRTEHSYRWDGRERKEKGAIVFQYTLNGQGAITIGDKTTTLTKGHAFFVKLPSDHCYYLPKESDLWEFAYITLYGQEAQTYYEKIVAKHGPILTLPTDSTPIKHIFRLLEKAETTGISQGYEASGYAYSFLMECMSYFEHEKERKENLPIAVAKAITFMEKNYATDITLDHIVEVSGLSKYHFNRLFKRTMEEPPIQYLAKIRVHHAMELLQQKELSMEEIARKVGYTNGNYFSKVFKNIIGVTPSNYRNTQSYMPVDRLFIDY
ncbi:AraC family transcriptional regulator [Gracilibacillus dipsosauri]|uniref:AraC family transcriptional regulator n=1 Tax=Gracilibacillus dipsosauri TaxID=178340 RepID=A0A317KV72_9BACI|nr:AraC family transcriptional regulator [Gracilibacillus dipsosauri]PWU67064.1 AraC family transcriptional regulator [Gracilibacillus dipsosauri]